MTASLKPLGNFLVRYGVDNSADFGDVCTKAVPVKGSGVFSVIGTPVVWVAASSAFEPYVAQTLTGLTSVLPDQAPIGFIVGNAAGYGYNDGDVTLSSTATTLTVLFRGDASVVESGIAWGASSDPQKAAFRVQAEKQGIKIVQAATSVTPSLI